MDATAPLVLASKTKEALFLTLWLALGETTGVVKDVDLRELGEIAERRGVRFSDAQIRTRLDALEKIGVVERVPLRERGRFDLFVYAPAPFRFGDEPNKTKREPETPLFDASPGAERNALFISSDSRSRFSSHFKNENEIGNKIEIERETAKSSKIDRLTVVETVEIDGRNFTRGAQERTININQEIKKENRPKIFEDEESASEPTPERPTKSAAKVREYVDFSSPAVAALRRDVCAVVWERGVRPDFVDRLTAAIALKLPGLSSLSELKAIDREAAESQTLFKVSKGFSGKEKRWQSTNLAARAIFESAGYAYPATNRGYEPNPNAARRPVPATRREPEPDETPVDVWTDEDAALVEGFSLDDLTKPRKEVQRRVAQKYRLSGIEVAYKANAILSALRRLQEVRQPELVGA